MDLQATIEHEFIDHTVTWAARLPVQIRHQLSVSAREQAALNRQRAPNGTQETGDQPPYFGNPALWEEIARRIDQEGHTPAD